MCYTPLPQPGRQVLPEHFADSLKHHFAAESTLRGLAGQGLVFRETAVVSQHDVGDGKVGRRSGAGCRLASTRKCLLPGPPASRPSTLTPWPMGRLAETNSCSLSRDKGRPRLVK